jgi:arabinofuranosyltransferase
MSRTWLLSVGLIAVAFWIQGAIRYLRDVQFIETEMVATARWVNANTPPTALIATHDIGALGYFSDRRLLDMAGLVSPGVIPFIRDEARLKAWLDTSGADYLVTFPSWYPALVASGRIERVYVTDSQYSQAPGAENMAIYRWNHSP